MAHENLFKIHIPEPCHENWDKMTPNEQGSFCKVCSKTVIDFSSKTSDEINTFFALNAEKKICGRFKISQLEETPKLKNEIPQYKINFPGYLFPTSYALALFVVASMALAGCSNSNADLNSEVGGGYATEHMIGKSIPERDTTNTNETILPDTNKIGLNENILNTMGGLSYHPVKDTAVTVDTTQEIRMLGEVYVKPDSLKPKNNETILMGKPAIKEKEYLKGDVKLEK